MTDIVVTPAQGNINFYDSGNTAIIGSIRTTSANDIIFEATGGVKIGNTSSDVYIGDGINNIDIVFEQDGEIRATDGKVLTIGYSNSSVSINSPLALNAPVTSTINSNVGVGSDILQVNGGTLIKRLTTNGGVGIGRDDAVMIGAGEALGYLYAGYANTNEIVYIGGDSGVELVVSPDNWSSGFAGRNYVTLNPNGAISVKGTAVINASGNWIGPSSGIQGAQGAAGPQGPQGRQGATGPQGPQGFQGAASTTAGPQGPQGRQGAASTTAGPQGPQGRQGAASTTAGPQGPQGRQGAASTTAGPQGPQGRQGATGPQGPQGRQGAQGAFSTTVSNAVNFQDNELSRPIIKDYGLSHNARGSISGAQSIDLTLGNYASATATGDITWTFSNPSPTANACGFVLELTNGGAYTMTWPAEVRWPLGTAPTLTASGVDVLVFITDDAGTDWRGMVSMLDSK